MTVTSDNSMAVKQAGLIILAVKPFQVSDVLKGCKKELHSGHVLVSVVTGVSIRDMEEIIAKTGRMQGNAQYSYRDPAKHDLFILQPGPGRTGAAGERYFSRLGKVAVIDEKLMDAATVLGACGNRIRHALYTRQYPGRDRDRFDAATASLIAAQTVKGAADLLLEKGSHPEQEIDKVTTPKGCTIAGLNEMEHQGFSSSLIKGHFCQFSKDRQGIVGLSWARMHDFSRENCHSG